MFISVTELSGFWQPQMSFDDEKRGFEPTLGDFRVEIFTFFSRIFAKRWLLDFVALIPRSSGDLPRGPFVNTKPSLSKTREINEKMEIDNRLPTGEWNGFYIESHQAQRGWMHLYMSFENRQIKGEGTDYVGPWVASGNYDLNSEVCLWEKKYLGKHKVLYSGRITESGIQGQWEISFCRGPFHIWPKKLGHLNELYLQKELAEPSPTILLETTLDLRIS